ncbi:MAG: hypothetical protein WBR18_13700 [Anaerolineales bacterium]
MAEPGHEQRLQLDTREAADLELVDGRWVVDFVFTYDPSCANRPIGTGREFA